MGRLTVPATGSVYVDANAVIYHTEAIEPYRSAAEPLWHALDAGTVVVVTSELTLLEVLVKPLKDGNAALASIYRQLLLTAANLTCVPISLPVLEKAAELRSICPVKTPDAIQAATAILSGAVVFLTNDAGFRRVPGLPVVVLSEVVASQTP